MKKLLICLLFVLIPAVALAQQEFTYKNDISWGMKLTQVASLEKAALHQNGYSYIINTGTTPEGLDTTLAYFFTLNDKLAQVAEIFDNYDYKRLPSNNYNNFSRIRADVISRYGQPLRERTVWLDLSAKGKFANDDIAAMIAGKAEMLSVWSLPDTDIMLSMRLDQNRVRITAVYQSKEHVETYFKEEAERRKAGASASY